MISGTYFKRHCRYRIGDYSDARFCNPIFIEDKTIDNNLVFIKTELINFFSKILNDERSMFPEKYSIVLHNSDINFNITTVRSIFFYFKDIEYLYTQNLLCEHPNAFPIPIGLANPKWSHGDIERIKKVMLQDVLKNNLVYINFNVTTNPKERNYCLSQIDAEVKTNYPNSSIISDHDDFVNKTHEQYLHGIKSSYFTVSPDGNGKDCHKTWESIYMKSIPIVTSSYFARKFKEYGIPILIIEDWSDYKHLKLNKDLYNKIWDNFDIMKLNDIKFWFKHD